MELHPDQTSMLVIHQEDISGLIPVMPLDRHNIFTQVMIYIYNLLVALFSNLATQMQLLGIFRLKMAQEIYMQHSMELIKDLVSELQHPDLHFTLGQQVGARINFIFRVVGVPADTMQQSEAVTPE